MSLSGLIQKFVAATILLVSTLPTSAYAYWDDATNINSDYMPSVTYWTFPDFYEQIKWRVKILHPDKIICKSSQCGFYVDVNITWEKDTAVGIIPTYPTEERFKRELPKMIERFFSVIDVTNREGQVVNSFYPAEGALYLDRIGSDANTKSFIPYEFTGPTSLTIFPRIERSVVWDEIIVLDKRAKLAASQIIVEEFVENPGNQDSSNGSSQVIEEEPDEWIINEELLPKTFEVRKGNDDVEEPDLVAISCKNKKTIVSIWAPNAITVKGKGKGIYKFDDDNSVKFTYQRAKNSNFVTLTNTKYFTSKLLKSTTIFYVEFDTDQGSNDFEHSKGNFNDLAGNFAKLGCKL
jgi:hypothetical protein